MRRTDNCRGEKPWAGLHPEWVILAFILALVIGLMLMAKANSAWTGRTVPEQLRQALFVAKDWD